MPETQTETLAVEFERLAGAATPGPWVARLEDGGGDGAVVTTFVAENEWRPVAGFEHLKVADADAAFVAFCGSHRAAILAALRDGAQRDATDVRPCAFEAFRPEHFRCATHEVRTVVLRDSPFARCAVGEMEIALEKSARLLESATANIARSDAQANEAVALAESFAAQRDATESAFTEEERAILRDFASNAEYNAETVAEPHRSSWALKARALRFAAEPRVQRDAMPGASPRWVAFVDCGASPSGKTRRWEVRAKQGDTVLGVVQWWPAWRRYTFQPAYPTVFEEDCMRDIAAFIASATAEHKERKGA